MSRLIRRSLPVVDRVVLVQEVVDQPGDVLAAIAQRRQVDAARRSAGRTGPRGSCSWRPLPADRRWWRRSPARPPSPSACRPPARTRAPATRAAASPATAAPSCRSRRGRCVPAVGGLEPPLLSRMAPVKRALHVPEQFALQQRAGQRAAVDADERLVPPRRVVVDRLGDHLLARAGLPQQQHRRPAVGDLPHRARTLRAWPGESPMMFSNR